MLGEPDVNGRADPPLEIPARNEGGSIPSVEELYAAEVAAAPYRYELPEQASVDPAVQDSCGVQNAVEVAFGDGGFEYVGRVVSGQFGGAQ